VPVDFYPADTEDEKKSKVDFTPAQSIESKVDFVPAGALESNVDFVPAHEIDKPSAVQDRMSWSDKALVNIKAGQFSKALHNTIGATEQGIRRALNLPLTEPIKKEDVIDSAKELSRDLIEPFKQAEEKMPDAPLVSKDAIAKVRSSLGGDISDKALATLLGKPDQSPQIKDWFSEQISQLTSPRGASSMSEFASPIGRIGNALDVVLKSPEIVTRAKQAVKDGSITDGLNVFMDASRALPAIHDVPRLKTPISTPESPKTPVEPPQAETVKLYHATPRSFNSFDPARSTPTGLGGKGHFFNQEPQASAYGDKVISVEVPRDKIATHADLENDPELKQGGNIDEILKKRGYEGIEGPAKGDVILYNPNKFLKSANPLAIKPHRYSEAQVDPAAVVEANQEAQKAIAQTPPIGVAERYVEAEQPGTVMPGTREDAGFWREKGRDYINQGGDPRMPIRAAQAGHVSPRNVGIVSAEHERFTELKRQAADALEADPRNPALQKNFKDTSDAWQSWRREMQPVLTRAGEALGAAIGEQPFDLGTFDGLHSKAMELNGGKELTLSQKTGLARRASVVRKARVQEAQAVERLGKEIDRTLPKRPTPTREEMLSIIENKVKQLTPC
jgi:hypothetical protein